MGSPGVSAHEVIDSFKVTTPIMKETRARSFHETFQRREPEFCDDSQNVRAHIRKTFSGNSRFDCGDVSENRLHCRSSETLSIHVANGSEQRTSTFIQ